MALGSTGLGAQTQSQAAAPIQQGANPGYTYGLGSMGGAGLQKSVDNPNVNTAYIQPGTAPVSSVGSGQMYQPKMQDAYYGQATSRLDPQWNQRQSGLENQLANMGLSRGSEAWNREMQNMSLQRNDAYGSAMNSAILNSGAEAQRMQGMEIAGGNFANTAAQQNYQNQLQSQLSQNVATGQQFNQNLQAGGFANAAQGQGFNQNLASAQLNNSAVTEGNKNALGWGTLSNEAAMNAAKNQTSENIAQWGNKSAEQIAAEKAATDRYGVDVGSQTQLGVTGMNTGAQKDIAQWGNQSAQQIAQTQAETSRQNAALQAQTQMDTTSMNVGGQRYVADTGAKSAEQIAAQNNQASMQMANAKNVSSENIANAGNTSAEKQAQLQSMTQLSVADKQQVTAQMNNAATVAAQRYGYDSQAAIQAANNATNQLIAAGNNATTITSAQIQGQIAANALAETKKQNNINNAQQDRGLTLQEQIAAQNAENSRISNEIAMGRYAGTAAPSAQPFAPVPGGGAATTNPAYANITVGANNQQTGGLTDILASLGGNALNAFGQTKTPGYTGTGTVS